MAYLLDNNALKRVLRQDPVFTAKFEEIPGDIWVSIIAVKESIDGHLLKIKEHEEAHSVKLFSGFDFLLKFIEEMQFYPIFPYDENSEKLFQSWGNWTKAIGKYDCRIAACGITNDLTVVTADKDNCTDDACFAG